MENNSARLFFWILGFGFWIMFTSCASAGQKKLSFVMVNKEEKQIRDSAAKVDKQQYIKKNGREYAGYRVKKGDSLWKIAVMNYGSPSSWKSVASANSLKPPYTIKPGQVILLPGEDKISLGEGNKNKKGKFTYITRKNDTWGAGEKLVYAVKYFMVVAGTGILEVKGIEEVRGRKAYYIEATARTTPFFDSFYRVKDHITSYMDVTGLFSWKYKKELQEGSYRAYAHIEFYPRENMAIKHTNEKYKVPAFTQDVLSELYYYRTLDLSPGVNDEVYIDVCADDGKAYQILVKKIGYEKVSVDAGEFDCIHVRPYLKYEGIFRQKGDVDIWFTNDKYKIPVLVKSKIVIGTIDAVLQSATIVEPD